MKPRLLVVVAVAALLLVFAMPPAGLVLGVMTIVLAVRALRATRPTPRELLAPDGSPVTVKEAQPGRGPVIVAMVLGVAATVLGAVLLTVLIVFWPELDEFTTCREQTNTNQGVANCEDKLKDAVFDRIGR